MRGRAVSYHSVSAMSANNIGTFEVGFMSEKIGAGNTLVFGGVVAVIVVLIIWAAWKGIREYRSPDLSRMPPASGITRYNPLATV